MEKVGGRDELIGRNVLDMRLFNLEMKVFLGTLVLALAATGCVTKSKADAQARAAYMAGQQAAYQSMGGAVTDVVVFGNVQKHEVPWVDGLTLAQALATANYLGSHDPQDIILKRNSIETEINPKDLLNGQNMELKPGDQISVVGQ
ncbi:MAG TPA: hypothetical protein VN048_00165 [Verrucomicrobiae bacterium]|jgi:hypothetical protein|nr:hypothetical protein [Verrucomicrobiae bacterium]